MSYESNAFDLAWLIWHYLQPEKVEKYVFQYDVDEVMVILQTFHGLFPSEALYNWCIEIEKWSKEDLLQHQRELSLMSINDAIF